MPLGVESDCFPRLDRRWSWRGGRPLRLTARQTRLLEDDSANSLATLSSGAHLADRRVVVTGGFGMLGGWVTYELLRMREVIGSGPAEVTVLASGPRRPDPIWIDRSESVQVVHLTEPIPERIPEADVYFHLASPASASAFLADPAALLRLNVQLTQALLEKCAESPRADSVVFASSSEVYGLAGGSLSEERVGEIPLSEGRWIYAEAKRVGELLCRTYFEKRGVGSVTLRPFHSFGPGLRKDDTRVFGEFTARIVDGLPLVVRGDPATTRCLAYAADVASAFLLTSAPACHGQAINVASPEPVSIGSLATALASAFYGQSGEVLFERDARSERNPVPFNEPDITKLLALGWKPVVDPLSAFQRTVEFMRESAQIRPN